MLEIITDEKEISNLREQWYRYFDFKEGKYQRYCANYPLTADGMKRFIQEGYTDQEFKDWFPLDTFLPDSIKKEIEEFKTKKFNPEDFADGLLF